MCPPKYIYWTSDCPFFFLGEWHQTRIPLTWWLKIPLEKLSFFSLANTCFINRDCSLDLGQDPAYAGRQLCRMGKCAFWCRNTLLFMSSFFWEVVGGGGYKTPTGFFTWWMKLTCYQYSFSRMQIKCVDHGVIKQWAKHTLSSWRLNTLDIKAINFVMKIQGLFKIGRQDAVYFSNENDSLTLFDCILLFSVDLLIHRYWDKKMGWREDACAPKRPTCLKAHKLLPVLNSDLCRRVPKSPQPCRQPAPGDLTP